MLTITAKVRLQNGKAEEFLDAYRWMRPLVMQDPGAVLTTCTGRLRTLTSSYSTSATK